MPTVRKTVRKRAPLIKKATNGKREAVKSKVKRNGSEQPVVALTQQQQLERERAQVVEELARLRAELQEAPEPTGDEVDLSVYDRERTLSLVASFQRRLEKIDLALRAAEKGEYGKCHRCGKPIDPERLRIFPETRHCITCKTELEQIARRSKV